MNRLLFVLLLFPVLALAKGKPDTLWTRTISRSEIAKAIQTWEIQQGEGFARLDSFSEGSICLDPSAIRTTADGGFIVAGTFGCVYNVSQTAFVLKTDETGESQWRKFFRRGSRSEAEDVWPTKDGGCLVSATIQSLGEGLSQVWILRLDASGDTLWTRMYRVHHYNTAGPIRDTPDGGCLVLLRTAVNPDNGPAYFHIVKLDSAGTPLWGRSYGETQLGADAGYTIDAEMTEDFGIIFAGTTGQSNAQGLSVVRTDSLGIIVWNKHFADWNFVADLAPAANGDYMILGRASLMRLTANGDSLWSRSFENLGDSEIRSCIELPDKDIAFTGQHPQEYNVDDGYWVEVLSTKGQPRRSIIMANEPLSSELENKQAREGIAMTLAPDGGLVIAGRTWPDGPMMYDNVEFPIICHRPTDLFLVKFRPRLGRK
ncbi:hypothetical protein KKH27_09700 [bacterium]|nr:hypothetical protein [bacterium]MBU1982910.1 hypothetical protein [bacterium]